MTDVPQIPPHDIPAELSLLGSAVLNPACIDLLDRDGTAEMFYLPEHGLVWRILADLRRRGTPIDTVMVRDELAKRGQYERLGGSEFLGNIVNAVPSATHAEHYAAIVRDKAERRAILAACRAAEQAVWDGDAPSDIVQATGKAMLDAAAGGSDQLLGIGDLAESALIAAEGGGVDLIPFPWSTLRDGVGEQPGLGGIAAGELCLIGARPSMGKSTFLRQMCLGVALSGVPTLLVSLEEQGPKIGRNALALMGRIVNGTIRNGTMGAAEWERAGEAAHRLRGVPLHVTTKARKLGDIRATVAGAMARHGVRFVAIDYLQRVRAFGESKYEQASNASTGVADIAAELGVAVAAGAQLNRGTEHRSDKAPTLSDLRESGKLEEDADTVLLLHRPSYYDEHDRPNELDVIAAKVRDGQRGGTYTLATKLSEQRFYDRSEDVERDVARHALEAA